MTPSLPIIGYIHHPLWMLQTGDFVVILNLLTYCTAGMQQLIWWVLRWFGFQYRKIHLQEQVLHNALPVAYLQPTTQHVNSSSGFVKLNGN